MLREIEAVYKNRTPRILGQGDVRRASVMLSLIKENDGLSVLFEVRGHKLRHQPGEICFPGGRIEEEDLNEEAAAIRETCEELGVSANDLEIIGQLDVFVTPHTIIYPYLSLLKEGTPLHPDPDEVAELFTVPLEFLVDNQPDLHLVPIEMKPPEDFPFDLIPNGKYYKWRKAQIPEYFYRYRDKVIWGITARILHDFLEKLKKQLD
ncbi:NUDIX hydrolase [Ammoniphilus resinae]|uniref:8-oxo-dGTP pyrophosphatase MutT (NUDIX family) n=1 Tax=Ammoniphilus resinae TaxID=861532 RepID=A0ABS4GWM3_9BACL|nr:CoA pyrophosphatase [Ammoniphilus resinae]MBP1934666.1 8-oxo-dGTP pyrophosphatase MutT (NUDIX family) [Ammoniphilus resinae]